MRNNTETRGKVVTQALILFTAGLVLFLTIVLPVFVACCGEECKVDCSDLEGSLCCQSDGDCSCGIHITDRSCFYGNKECVDESRQCPDFCTGDPADYVIRCVDSLCQQVHRTE